MDIESRTTCLDFREQTAIKSIGDGPPSKEERYRWGGAKPRSVRAELPPVSSESRTSSN